jgi:hypothetical protein
MERKYFLENTAPFLNANVENSIGFFAKNGILKITLLCKHCNSSMTWCNYNKIKDKDIYGNV